MQHTPIVFALQPRNAPPEPNMSDGSDAIFNLRNVMDMATTATESIGYDLAIVALMATLRERAGRFD